MKRKPKTEFVQDEKGHCKSLYVDGLKTNIYYWLPEYPFYDFHSIKERQKAETVKLLIDTGQILEKNWEDFDLCRSIHYKIGAIIILPAEQDIPFDNRILSCSGSDYTNAEAQTNAVAQYFNKKEYTQWTKRVSGNTILKRVGIKFYAYGYALGFII